MDFDLILKNGICILPTGIFNKDIGIIDGLIKAIDNNLEHNKSKKVIDCNNKYIIPGVIDSQVHFRDPGLTHKEDIQTGSKSAVLGGVTTFLEMPNTTPPTTNREKLIEKIEIAKSKSFTNFGFFIGATENNLSEILKLEGMTGLCGIKIFLGSSTGSLLLNDPKILRDLFIKTRIPIAIHSENEDLLQRRISIQKCANHAKEHYKWRNVETAFSATKKIIEIAKETNRKIHLLHISSKDEMIWLQDKKEHCTVEVTPQHLYFDAPNCYEKLNTLVQMNPPIREEDHRTALWEGVNNKTVDIIGSDHAPHTLTDKNRSYPLSPSGMPGTQTMLPIMLNFVNIGKLEMTDLVRLLCKNPAKLYGLKNKGELSINKDADITIIDLHKKYTILNENMASKCGWTPYHGDKMQGMPTTTIISGNIVVENGKLVSNDPIKNLSKPITQHR